MRRRVIGYGGGEAAVRALQNVDPRLDQDPFSKDQFARIRAAAIDDARGKLRDRIPEDIRTYCTVDAVVVEGRAHREIPRLAKEKAPI